MAKMSLATQPLTPQDALGVIARPKAAKVTEPRRAMTPEDSQPDSRVSLLFFEAADAAHGKRESAAAEVGKDRANFTRDAKKWMETLEGLGPVFLARFGAGLLREFGAALETPAERGERVIDGIEAGFSELRQLIRHLAK